MASQTIASSQSKTIDLPRLMVAAGLLAGVLFTGGTYWDGSWHLEYGRDTFWSPPHLLIYGAILMMLVIAALALDLIVWLLVNRRPPRFLKTSEVLVAVTAGTAAFAAIHIGLMAPMIEQATGLPHLPEGAVARALPWAVIAAALAAWAGLWLGRRLAGWGEKSL